MIDIIEQLDTNILNFIHNDLHNSVFDFIMPIITFLGNGYLLWIVVSIILTISKKYRKAGITMAVALILCAVMGEMLIKNIVKRPRPYEGVTGIQLLIPKLSSYSFPSGHTLSSFAAAFVIFKYMRKWAIPAFILAVLIAFSRNYLYVHYPFDVLAGAVFGGFFAWVAIKIPVNRVLKID